MTEGGEIKEALNPIMRPAQVENYVNTRSVPLPSNKYVNQPIIQPIVEKENLQVRFIDGEDRVYENESISRQPIVQNKYREESIERPGDVYYRQNVIRPYITKEHLQVDFQQPQPVLTENEKIVRPAIESANQYTLQHNLAIPVEDQRLVATPAKVGYDVPIYHYQYVPVQQEECVPCCGCAPKTTVSNYTNLYAYGEKDRKKPWEQEESQYDWTDVISKFEQKYGRGTFDISLLNDGRGREKVYTVDELAKLMGLDKKEKKKNYIPHDYKYEVTDKYDPHGNEWVNLPNMKNWRHSSYETYQHNNKWNPHNMNDHNNQIFL